MWSIFRRPAPAEPKRHVFTPAQDVTTGELALIVAHLCENLTFPDQTIKSLRPELRRHFTPVKCST